MTREYKAFAEFKLLEDGPGGFEGYASLFGIRDDGGDTVDAGAFSEALEPFLRDGFIARGHDWDALAIGTIAVAQEDDRGLFLRTEYHSTADAQAARIVAAERMSRGKSVGLSIGYDIKDGGVIHNADGSRRLTKLGLFEVSQVNVPMLRPAGLTSVKGFGIPFDDHSKHVRVAVSEWLERARSGSDVRSKDSRAMSVSRLQQLDSMRTALLAGADELESLLKSKPTETSCDASQLFLEFQRTLSAIRS